MIYDVGVRQDIQLVSDSFILVVYIRIDLSILNLMKH